MSAPIRVLLMTPDVSLPSAVDQSLRGNGHVLDMVRPQTARELLTHLGRSTPCPVVLVDLDPHQRDVLIELERAIARFPETRFVGLAQRVDSELLLEAMQAGLRRVVAKHTLEAELKTVLDRLGTGLAPARTPEGELFTILSASGGGGATTIAINLAEELAVQQQQRQQQEQRAQQQLSPTENQRSLLIDLDCQYGAMSTYLGLEPQYGIDQVLRYAGPIDTELMRTTASAYGDWLHVLASPASVRFARPEPLDIRRLHEAVRCSRRAYRHTIVDAPRVSMELAAMLAGASTRVLVVLQLTVKDIRTTQRLLDALRELGVDSGAVLIVANRYAKRQMIGLDDATKALGPVKIACLRNDYTAALNGLNFGQTLGQAAPRSVLRRDLQELCGTLCQTLAPIRA